MAAAKEKRAAEEVVIGAIEQLVTASREAAKDGRHGEHAMLEGAVFALYTARTKLESVDLDGSVGAIKALF